MARVKLWTRNVFFSTAPTMQETQFGPRDCALGGTRTAMRVWTLLTVQAARGMVAAVVLGPVAAGSQILMQILSADEETKSSWISVIVLSVSAT